MDADTGDITRHQLHLGTRKFPFGMLAFKPHKAYHPLASLHISIHAGRWHVSFNYDDLIPEPTDKDMAERPMQLDKAELHKMTAELDRDTKLPLAGSDHEQFDFSNVQKKRLLAQERHKKRWQRRQARHTNGSADWVKAKHNVARYQLYDTDVHRDVTHKTSHTLVSDPQYKLFVFEALKVKNMTASAKGTVDAPVRNVRQKVGLNKSILAATWGQTKTYLQYKARRRGKLVIDVPPFYSSQECAVCGHVH